jgi:hypothetical protein
MSATISWRRQKPTSNGRPVPEGSDIPRMRARTGKRGSNKVLMALLDEAQEDLGRTPCAFWACEGPKRMVHMVTCIKCSAMRNIATVRASLQVR